MTMPDRDSPRKPRRRWLVLPYAVVAIGVVAWSAYWFYAKGRIAAELDAMAGGRGAASVSYSSRSIGGYPFRFLVTFNDLRASEPSGWGLAAPVLEVEAAAYDLSHVVLVAPRGLTITRPGKGAVDVAGEALRASIGGFSTRLRFSIEATKLRLSPRPGAEPFPFSSAERFEVHLRPEANDRARLFFGITGGLPTAGSQLSRVTDGKTTLRLEAELTQAQALRGRDWPSLVRRWAQAGGQMTVARAEANVGQLVLSSENSTLSVEDDGRLRGKLDLRLSQGAAGMMALGAAGVLPDETAAVGAGLAGSGPHFALRFKGGDTLVGPLPIGKAPRVY